MRLCDFREIPYGDGQRGGRKWLTLLLCLTDVGHLVRAELGKPSTATTAFARSRLPRSLLSAHFVAASAWFVGVTGLSEKWLSGFAMVRLAMMSFNCCCKNVKLKQGVAL